MRPILPVLACLVFATPAWAQEAPSPDAAAEPSPDATPAIPEVWAPVPLAADGRSAYGLYLAGKLAVTRGQGEAGADLLAEAHALAPEQPRLREQAFTAAILAGDLGLAGQITPQGEGVSPTFVEAGRLIRAVTDFAGGDAGSAHALLSAQPIQPPHRGAGLLVQPWIAAAAGDQAAALAEPPTGLDPLTTLLLNQNRALLLEVVGRPDEAEAILKAMVADAAAAPLFRQAYGEFLERRGRRAEALALYEADAESDPALARAAARVRARGRAPAAPDLRRGAGLALAAAAAPAGLGGAHEFAVVYLRLSRLLDPGDLAEGRLAQALARAGYDHQALDVFARIGRTDPILFAAARVQRAMALARLEDDEAALADLRLAVAAAPRDRGAAQVLASQLAALDRYDEALAILNGDLLNREDQDFQTRFMRGAAYESLGRIPEAEAELWAALQLRPDDPLTLNYLGYLWVDRGLRVHQGAEMIARALAAEPDNGHYRDSLGWAQYRQGQFETAVVTLEGAVDKEPGNAEINDHLGDAYWQVGRRREAAYQWRRALSLDPDTERRAGLERKLAEGLEAVEGGGR